LTPEIDVIVPQYGQVDHTLRFLRSFKTHAPYGTRLILVDNGTSAEEFERVVPALKDVYCTVWRNPTNLGFVQATNQGLKLAKAPYVVFQNNDTEIYDGTYQNLQAALARDPQAGVVGAVSSPCGSWVGLDRVMKIYKELTTIPGLLEAHHGYRAFLMRNHLPGVTKTVAGMVPFFCVMFPKHVLDVAGPLSEDYGVGLGDDDDYCALLRSMGLKILLDLSTYVFHNHRTTFRALYTADQIHDMQRKNVAKFVDKWRKGRP